MFDYSEICKKYKIKSLIDLIGKETVFLRVDFNVPIDKNGKIVDDLRIRGSRDTIELLLKQELDIILVSHLGDPKSGFSDEFSFKRVQKQIERILGSNITLSIGKNLDEIATELEKFRFRKEKRQLFMIDNIRFFHDEKLNNLEFAKDLIKKLKIDHYINDAFSVSHRKHASVVAIPSMMVSKFAGFSLLYELYMLDSILADAFHPGKIITAILGGKKVETKMLLLRNLANRVDNLVIVGGMANTFLKARGVDIGNSFYETEMLDIANEIENVVLPIDFIDEKCNVVTQLKDKKICDVGPLSLDLIADIISQSDVVVWNGPAGICEDDRFAQGTNKIAKSIAKHSIKSVIGGGDTAAVIRQLNLKIDHISSGGGAFIVWLENKNLIGIDSIQYS